MNTSPPKHIAIIMDGNGRWAKQRLLPRLAGHQAGKQAGLAVIEASIVMGLKTLSLFAFSSENWQRPATEVNCLMTLLHESLRQEVEQLHQKNVQLCFIGERAVLSKPLQKQIEVAEALTQHNTGLQLCIAINYGGRWDIIQATKTLVGEVQRGALAIEDIDETLFSKQLSLGELGEPDLLIRSSGEQRLSNFFLWHLAYSELYFTEVLWPDFRAQHLQEAIQWYCKRQRRFGKVDTPC